MHEIHKHPKGLLIASQRVIHQCDHIGVPLGNHLAVLSALIAIQYLFYADTRQSLRPARRAATSTLAKLTMSRWPALPNLIVAGIRLRFEGVNVGVGRVSQFGAPL